MSQDDHTCCTAVSMVDLFQGFAPTTFVIHMQIVPRGYTACADAYLTPCIKVLHTRWEAVPV